MTTIIGIAGTDPETLENYVVLCADSRGSSSSALTPLGNNEKKIFANETGNYAIGSAGKCLEKYMKQSEPRLNDLLNNPRIESKESVVDALESINAKLKMDIGEENEFLVSFQEEVPKVYTFFENNLKDAKAYSATGSGMYSVSSLEQLNKYKVDGRIKISKRMALDVALEAMNEAASDAKLGALTGGHMDVAIISGAGVKFISNYAQIKENTSQRIKTFDEDINVPNNGLHHFYRNSDDD